MSLEYYTILIIKIACSLGQQYAFRSDSALANIMCSAEKVQFSTTFVNDITCVRACSLTQNCHAVIFYHENNTCFGLNTDDPFNVSIPLSGAVFYKLTIAMSQRSARPSTTTAPTTAKAPTTATTAPPTTTTIAPTTGTTAQPGCVSPLPLVANVSDSQLSSSSQFSSIYMAYMGKLNYAGGYWAPDINRVEEYIQVDFQGLRVATAVITQGGGNTQYNNWITYYSILISIDCVTYTVIPDSNGFEQVFPGNTDIGSHVTNNLDPPVSVRCLRLHAQSWHDWIGIRFEVMGCIP